MSEILNTTATVAGNLTAVFVLIAFIYKPFRKWIVKNFVTPESKQDLRMDEFEKKQKLIENAIIALLQDSLYHECKSHIKNEYIDIDDFKNLENRYKPYEALNGNGTYKMLFEKVKSIYIKGGV